MKKMENSRIMVTEKNTYGALFNLYPKIIFSYKNQFSETVWSGKVEGL